MFGLPPTQDAIVTFLKVFSFGIAEPKNGMNIPGGDWHLGWGG